MSQVNPSLWRAPPRRGDTLWEVLHDRGLLLANKEAIISPAGGQDGSGERRLTYLQLSQEALRLAEQLVRAGVQAGDHVGIVLTNTLEFVLTFLAVVSMRGVAAPLNPALKQAQFEFFLEDMDVHHIILPSKGAEEARLASQALNVSMWTISPLTGVDGRFSALVPPSSLSTNMLRITPDTSDWTPVPGDRCLFLHTSGTTGRPKGVPLSHANLTTSMYNITGTYDLSPSDTCMVVMPLFHVHGLIGCLLSTLYSGGCSVIQPDRFSATTFWPLFLQYKCTWYSAVPTIQQILLSCAHRDYKSSGHLRFIRSCSASLAPATLRQLEATFHAPVVEAYAMSEAAHQMTANYLPPGTRKPGSVGRGRGVPVTIRSEEGELPQGSKGEVCIKGRNVMEGYYNNPVANAANFTKDGWFRTGDQGYLDEDGFLFLTGRLKEMINRGGEKIAPVAVDEVLLEHPAVSIAVTFGVPDKKYGEEVHAAIVLKAEAKGKNVEEVRKSLEAHCSSKLPGFSCPKVFHFSDDVPRTATGKVQRRIVAEHFLKAAPKAKL